MRRVLDWLSLAGLIGVLAVSPFVLMELITRRQYDAPFPFPLFIIMWLAAAGAALAVIPAARAFRSDGLRALPRPLLWLCIALALLFTYLFAQWTIDQWPCFIGVRLCD